MVYSALAVGLMAEGTFFVPLCAQDKAVQVMSLTTLYDLADQQSQKVRVSEAALRAANEGVAAAKSALLPSVDLNLQGSYTGNAFMLSRGFSTHGTTDYIVPGIGAIPVANGKQDTPHWGNSFTAQVAQVVYAGGAIRSGIRMAELGKEMAELDVEKDRQEVRFLLTGYCLDLCKLNNQIEVVRQHIALTQKEIEQMKARREQGTVLQNDITRYELQLQGLELTLTKLTDASTVINHQLVTTLHLPAQTVVLPDKHELKCALSHRFSRAMATDSSGQQPGYSSGNSGHQSRGAESEASKSCIIAISCVSGGESALWSIYARPYSERLQCKRVVRRGRCQIQPWQSLEE